MKNYTLILLLAVLILTEMSVYSQTPITLETNRVTEKRYGISLSGHHLDFMYEFTYPTSDTLALPKIKEQVLVDFFSSEPNLYTIPQDLILDDFDERLKCVQRWYEAKIIDSYTDATMDSWFVVRSYDFKTSALRNIHNKVLAYYIDSRHSYGIAHPRCYCTCINYDLQTGDRISLNDLFDSISLDKMNKIVNEVLKSQGNYTVGANQNFIILPQGIQFVYDEYEAGCYADGTVRATIPLSKFRHLLKDSALTYFEE